MNLIKYDTTESTVYYNPQVCQTLVSTTVLDGYSFHKMIFHASAFIASVVVSSIKTRTTVTTQSESFLINGMYGMLWYVLNNMGNKLCKYAGKNIVLTIT